MATSPGTVLQVGSRFGLNHTRGTSDNPVARKALSFARSQSGKPYQWGGAGPAAYDCSGLVMASYLAAGITMPRVAADQARDSGTRAQRSAWIIWPRCSI